MAIYMKFGKVDGDVVTDGYAKWIELGSCQFGAGRGISSPTGSAARREASAPSLSEVTVTKQFDMTSNPMFEAATQGTKGTKCEIAFTRSGVGTSSGKQVELLRLTLDESLISGYSMSSGGDRPSESLSLNYTKIEVKYTPMTEAGTAGDPVTSTFDLEKMTA
jgi:type VI secretion system secreted protein Hcp